MKKICALLLAVAMIFALVACGTSEKVEEAPAQEAPAQEAVAEAAAPVEEAVEEVASAEAKDPSELKVVALLPGTITDNGWNFICYDALKSIYAEYKGGGEPEYIENIAVSDMAGYIRQYAEDGYDMIIIHGAQFEAAATECAPLYPDVHFCLSYGFKIDGSTDANILPIDNLAYVGPVGMGVAVGGILAILSDNNKIVFLGGMDTPAIADIASGIGPGAKLVKPDCEVAVDYLGTLTDQDKAREAAKAYIDQGYDAICASANSAQLGCLWAAEDAGVYALGFNSDQYSVAPGAVVRSVIRNYSMIYKNVFDKLAAGQWQGGKVAYDVTEQGTIVSEWHGWDEKLPAEKVQAIDDFINKLFAGEYAGQY